MALGNNRPRNWGKDAQSAFLKISLLRKNLKFLVNGTGKQRSLFLAPNHPQFPFLESYCQLRNISRGKWEAFSLNTGERITSGCSLNDIIGKIVADM